MAAPASKIVVIGNCQARPVCQILGARTGAQMLEPIILHLAREEDESRNCAAIESADLILAQLTSSDFRPVHLASQHLAENYAAKTFIWPNIFYCGQQPFLRYITSHERGRILGPLESYHDLRLLRRWALARGVDAIGDFDEASVVDLNHRVSLDQLRQRETSCNVGVADLIEKYHDQRRLFFTFNHPVMWLMEQMCEQFSAAVNLRYDAATPFKNEPLARIVGPSIWQEWPGEALPFRGQVVSYAPNGRVVVEGVRLYTESELEAEFFRTYDHIAPGLNWRKMRYTPDYSL